jgi:hypothetical protein
MSLINTEYIAFYNYKKIDTSIRYEDFVNLDAEFVNTILLLYKIETQKQLSKYKKKK